MKIYIAGPMSGFPNFNYPTFDAAAESLAAIGHEPINPARTEGREDCETWGDYMRASIRDIADADGIALLPDWELSNGARLEWHLACNLGLRVQRLERWIDPSLHFAVSDIIVNRRPRGDA